MIIHRTHSHWIAAVLLALASLFALAAPAFAREEIRSFTTNTTLRVDGSVEVVETLEINVEGDEIRRGIYRDIPTQLVNLDGSRLRSNLNVLEVKRDGRNEQYSIENIGSPDSNSAFKRIMIGDADVFLEHRVHTYTIRYTMTRMARYFEDHDELFWNATGNYWNFPIVKSTATLNVPAGALIDGAIGYTGAPGSTEQAVTIDQTSETSVAFRTTRELSPGEGLSVAVKFQKGILLPPEGLTGVGNWISDHRELVFPTFAVLLVLLYNYFAWSAVGRDPARGTIIPLFHAPKGMSPALLHYIGNMGFKGSGWTAFTASIFDLGVKGLVQIDKSGDKLRITATGKATEKLPPGEQGLYDYIRSKGTVTVDKTDGPKLNEKRGELISALERENREVYFKNNVLYTLGGVALAAALLGALVWLDVLDPIFLVVAAVGAIIIGIILGVVFGSAKGGVGGKIIAIIWFVIVGFNFLGAGVDALAGFRFNIDTGLIAAISIFVIEIIFAILMRAPTIQGRKLMDQIEGFKMYMETAEKNRLNYVDKGEPAMSVTRFETILPFAIAMGVEKPWSDRFEADLMRNAVEGATAGSYSPGWYRGSSWSTGGSSGDFSKSFSSIATGMSAAMIAAQPSTSSGSGFSGGGGGGGGSSGGGGGGGGGGGW
ncbi:MAG: DUF2207 domain-containing protein [Devosia sp.]